MPRTCGMRIAVDLQDTVVLNFLTRLFNKPKEPITVKKMLCSKHGELSHFALWCNKVEYPFFKVGPFPTCFSDLFLINFLTQLNIIL